jgi:hypothetical protein
MDMSIYMVVTLFGLFVSGGPLALAVAEFPASPRENPVSDANQRPLPAHRGDAQPAEHAPDSFSDVLSRRKPWPQCCARDVGYFSGTSL